MKEKNYSDLATALEKGLSQRYGGQFSVEVKSFKQEHGGNPFCAIYPVQLIIYAKDGSLAGTGPQQDLFASNGHEPEIKTTRENIDHAWEKLEDILPPNGLKETSHAAAH